MSNPLGSEIPSSLPESLSPPDMITPIVGWRAWLVRPSTLKYQLPSPFVSSESSEARIPTLRSIWHDDKWPRGRSLTAMCFNPRLTKYAGPFVRLDASTYPDDEHHEMIPVEGCLCGIYATKSLPDLLNDAMTGMNLSYEVVHSFGVVVGTVELWGKVIQHETGYRAQHARPKMILVNENFDMEVAGSLASSYQCEVKRVASWNRLLTHFSSSAPIAGVPW